MNVAVPELNQALFAAAGDASVQNPVKLKSRQIKDMALVNFLYMGLFLRFEKSGRAG
jgi:hypothetical protein